MKESVSYTLPPVKERLLSSVWLFIFFVLSGFGVFLMVNGLSASLYGSTGELLFFGGFVIVFFSVIYFLRNINFLRKYRYSRTYTFTSEGITIAYAHKKEVYRWETIASWIESRKVDAMMYEKAPSRTGINRIVSKQIANFGKTYLETPNWIDIKLISGKVVLIEVPESNFEKVVTFFKSKPQQL